MNFSCNCHSGTAPAYQCNLHCCLRTLPRFKHFRSHQSNLCTGQPSVLFAVPCCADLPTKKPCVLPHLSPSASSQLHLSLAAAFTPELSAEVLFAPGAISPSWGSSWACGEQGGCLVLSAMMSLVHTGSRCWNVLVKCQWKGAGDDLALPHRQPDPEHFPWNKLVLNFKCQGRNSPSLCC